MTLGTAFELLITQNMEILGKLSEQTKQIDSSTKCQTSKNQNKRLLNSTKIQKNHKPQTTGNGFMRNSRIKAHSADKIFPVYLGREH
jgi:hypothetical protein